MEEDLKSLARTLVSATNALAALGAGSYFLVNWIQYPSLEGSLLSNSKGSLALVGCAVLLLNAIRLLYFRAGRRRDLEGPLLSKAADGTVHVSREAVESGLRSAGEALDEITRLRVKVLTPARKRTLVRAHYLAPEDVSILDLSSRLRTVLMERFGKLVQLESEGKLELEMIFEGFYGKSKSAPVEVEQQAVESEPVESPPFTGPRYPIDEEESP